MKFYIVRKLVLVLNWLVMRMSGEVATAQWLLQSGLTMLVLAYMRDGLDAEETGRNIDSVVAQTLRPLGDLVVWDAPCSQCAPQFARLVADAVNHRRDLSTEKERKRS